MTTPALATMDGRRARAAKTREAIVDALLSLLDEGDPKPTAAMIAARAGLSVRSVFQHFVDLEDLFVAVSDRQANRVSNLYTGIRYEGDLDSRIEVFVRYRARLYETVAPIRRAAILQEPFSPIIASRLRLARALHRMDVERAFGTELEAARAAGDVHLIDALAASCSFVVWDEMRQFDGLDVDTTAEALRRTVSGLLATVPK